MIEEILLRCDKDLFVQFRDKKLTFDQFLARISERQGQASYIVLDDIKKDLHPSILEGLDEYQQTMDILYKGKKNISIEELLRPLEPWEANKRCLRSL